MSDQSNWAAARESAWMASAETGQIVSGLLIFLLIGRSLGPESWGRLISVVAMMQSLTAICSLGIGHLALSYLARGDDAQRVYSLVVGSSLVSAVLSLVGSLIAKTIFLPQVGYAVVLFVAATEAFAALLVNDLSLFALSRGGARLSAQQRLTWVAFRILPVVAFIVFGLESLTAWAACSAVSATIGAITILWSVARTFGLRVRMSRRTSADMRAGFPFGINMLSASFINDLDKTMLSAFQKDVDTGIYGAAYRIVSMSLLPVSSLVSATYARLFDAGAKKTSAVLQEAKRLTLLGAGAAALISTGLFVFSGATEILLGPEYAGAVIAVRWLAFLPLLKALQLFAANSLSGSGHQWSRVRIMFAAGAVNLIANLILIPAHGWRGAAIATYISELLLVTGYWTVLIRRSKHDRMDGPQAATETANAN